MPRAANRLGAVAVVAGLVGAAGWAAAPAPAAPVTPTTVSRTTTPTTAPPGTTSVPTTSPTTTTRPTGTSTTTHPTTTAPSTTTPGHRGSRSTTTTTTAPAPAPRVAPPGLSLVFQPPWIPTQGAEVLLLHLDAPAVAAQPGAGVQLTVHRSVTSRTDFDNAVNGTSLPRTRTALTFPFSSLHLDAHANFAVGFGLSGSAISRSVGISSPGVYPIEVGLVDTKVNHSTFLTWMVVVDPQQARGSQPLRVSWIWQLGARPFELAHGVDTSTLAAMRPGGRLDDIATLLARAGNFPLTLGIGPETLQAWAREAETRPALTRGFRRVRTAANRASTQLLPEPYVPIAGPTIEAEGLGSHLPEEGVAGSEAIDDATGQIPDPRTAFVDPVDAPTIEQLTQMQASRFVVRDSALAPIPQPLTPAQPFELAAGTAAPAPAAASDTALESLIGRPGPPALREQRLLAALAEIAYEAPSQPRGVVLTTPDDWAPDVATMTLLLHDLARDPLVEPATLDMLFTEVPAAQADGAPLRRRLAPIPTPAPLPLRASDYDDAVHDLAAYQSMVGPKDPSIAAARHSFLLALSTANTRAGALAYLGTIKANLKALTSGITTTAKTLTLTARRADLPLSFQNNTGRAGLLVRVHLDSQKLIFPKGGDFLLKLPIGHYAAKRNEFPVEARASGTFVMTIRLKSPDDSVALGPPIRVTIRSAVFSGIGVALTLAALLFLAGWWGQHFFRTRRVRRRAGLVSAGTDADRERLVRSSAAVATGTLLSRLTGLLRVAVLAYTVGRASLADTYNLANSTPNIVYELILGGVLSATLVPLFVEHLENHDTRATSALFTVAMTVLTVLTAIAMLFAPLIARLYAVDTTGSERVAQLHVMTIFTLWFLPQMIFYGFTALASALLNAHRRFVAAAFAPVVNNVIVIGVLIAFAQSTAGFRSQWVDVRRISGDAGKLTLLGLGTTAGIAAMALVLVPALRRARAGLYACFDWRHPAVRKMLRLSGWTIGYVVTNQVALLFVLVLAKSGSTGNVSAYLYAYAFFQVPHGLIAVSIMTTMMPELSRSAARFDYAGLAYRFRVGLRYVLLLMLPAALLFIALAQPMLGVLVRGGFRPHDASVTAGTLQALAIGLVPFSVYLYTLRGFYALPDTFTPFWINAIENGVNIVLAVALFPSLGVQGLALAWSGAYAVAAVIALVVLGRRVPHPVDRAVGLSAVRAAVGTLVLAIVAASLAAAIGHPSANRALFATAVAGLAGCGVYAAALAVMRTPELAQLVSVLRRRREPVDT